MKIVRLPAILLTALLAVTGVLTIGAGPSSAAPGCPDVQVVFARGTLEGGAPVGFTGQSFAAALDNRLAGKSVRTSAVRYPASGNFNNRVAFVQNVVTGIRNAQAQILSTIRRCPGTDIVLGGYSQGAAVVAYAVADRFDIPAKYERYRSQAPDPLPSEVARHISAVVLFGPPSARWLRDIGAPPIRTGGAYRGKTARYCNGGDNVCDGAPVGQPTAVHVLYSVDGTTVRAADFSARRIR
ncbi:hypothetical protein GOHSU_24_00090 [Gordonia hirsuta DSM 44140 = NBRC 16056]|uniref:Cutinase n=1 Tax=Gordonia hirsuta DSM 44140 = NBRC 16056 TaxID=1121927 RepID=L7L993_9ACTN|nr:cutinase family protein [Gordonia hirsuta]GAC57720.1 hypothetical protein GOHSU_24_00090 [Gordonia hirsuta DSM 44140 = NBRC 16056]